MEQKNKAPILEGILVAIALWFKNAGKVAIILFTVLVVTPIGIAIEASITYPLPKSLLLLINLFPIINILLLITLIFLILRLIVFLDEHLSFKRERLSNTLVFRWKL
jgi:hypothetical protein